MIVIIIIELPSYTEGGGGGEDPGFCKWEGVSLAKGHDMDVHFFSSTYIV